MQIEQTMKTLADIRDEIKKSIANGEHVFEQLTKKGERITAVDVPTGQLPTAAGAIQMAITNLEGHLQKAAEIAAANKKVETEK